jgi:hypothetical protein
MSRNRPVKGGPLPDPVNGQAALDSLRLGLAPQQSYEDIHGPMPRGPPIDAHGLAQQVVDDSSELMRAPHLLVASGDAARWVVLRFSADDVVGLSTPAGDGTGARLKTAALERELASVAESVREHARRDVALSVEQLLDQLTLSHDASARGVGAEADALSGSSDESCRVL